MRKISTVLIFLLLLSSTSALKAQDVADEDLEALLDDSSELKEFSEEASVDVTTEPATTVPTEEAVVQENLPNDTVDLSAQDLDLDMSVPDSEGESDIVQDSGLEPELNLEVSEAPENGLDDDLESLRKDIGDTAQPAKPQEKKAAEVKVSEPAVFDVGGEERELITLSQNIQGQITDDEWNEVATAAKAEAYTVVQNDWLFKISKRFFGTGFYYPKIWSLNSYITNPHFIEPGMVLSFTTGSSSTAPEFKLGSFTADELAAVPGSLGNQNAKDFSNFGENTRPGWIDEKSELADQGVYFQYASEETMDDLLKEGEKTLVREYEHYQPPFNDFEVVLPKNYDANGFDNSSKIFYSYKEGFYLSTFLSTNVVQDFGSIVNGPDENIFFVKLDKAYIQLDETVKALPGDIFSIYNSGGKVKQINSDREGYKYTIIGQIKLLRKIQDKWEVEFIEVSGTPQRGDRVTVYTPKIDRITTTYNSRLVEAAIMGSFHPTQTILGFGDVVYLDRGRADGVEMGNVFEVFGFKDRLTSRNITNQPTYKTGELTVITLTDNYATALVTKSLKDFYAGDIAITKTKESMLREKGAKSASAKGQRDALGGKALEELDVELNLDNLNDDLLREADKIQLTEDELAELERQEREKSVIKDSERDLKALERLENEIEQAERILNDAKLDEDKLLEEQNLNEIEKKQGNLDQDSLDEIEENLGKRFIDEDLNSKDNPFGLTEFDVEEIDELLNVEKKSE